MWHSLSASIVMICRMDVHNTGLRGISEEKSGKHTSASCMHAERLDHG